MIALSSKTGVAEIVCLEATFHQTYHGFESQSESSFLLIKAKSHKEFTELMIEAWKRPKNL